MNKNAKDQTLQDEAKVLFKGKFIALNACNKKRLKINVLNVQILEVRKR